MKSLVYKKLISLIGLLLIIWISTIIAQNLLVDRNIQNENYNKDKQEFSNNFDGLQNSDLSSSNVYSGIGAAWNVTHWANRTDSDLPVSFQEKSYDNTAKVPLGSGWDGYQLNANIKNLYDTRNWCNGTFKFGPDDNSYGFSENDSSTLTKISSNKFQNWTFGRYDYTGGGYTNPMTGNYIDSSTTTPINVQNHDCVELRMQGFNITGPWTCYEEKDRCYWTSKFSIPRGKVVDSALQFDFNPYHLSNFNTWKLIISLNNIQIYSIGTFELKDSYGLGWHTISLPQYRWTNTSNIFTNPVNNQQLRVNFTLQSVTSSNYASNNFLNINYQQILIDNIKLETKAEVRPTQIQLVINRTNNVNDVDWGKGSILINGKWNGTQNPYVSANFSSNDVGILSNYSVDFKTDLNLFSMRHNPDTNYETDAGSLGTKFTVSNNSKVDWDSYCYLAVPTGYKETEMRISFPSDVNITWISTALQPSVNVTSLCNRATKGLLIVPISTITSSPNGFWKVLAVSKNYFEQIRSYNNRTGSWALDTQYRSGEYLNITAKINNSAFISSYITQTKAILNIRFPNGTIWSEKTQIKSPNTNGYLYFSLIKIPSAAPNYETGEYQAIITWNNSRSIFGINETGVIYKKFNVVHYSTLTPEQQFYGNIMEDSKNNIKVTFKDEENNKAIENAIIYCYNFTNPSVKQYFVELSPGFYLLELNVSGAKGGDNNLTIFASSSLYVSSQINVTLQVIKDTIFETDESILSVSWNDIFTIKFNYTEKKSGNGISISPTNNWIGQTSTIQTSLGKYEISCNSSMCEINKVYSLIIQASNYGYVSQSLLIRVEIVERETLLEISVNGIPSTTFEYFETSIGEFINITAWYRDTQIISQPNINLATLQLIGMGTPILLEPNLPYNQYNVSITAEGLGTGTSVITISAQKYNYSSYAKSIIFDVKERKTTMILYINGTIVAQEDTYKATIGDIMNITVKYKDFVPPYNFVDNATIELLGIGSLANQTIYEQYNINVSAGNFEAGINILTLFAQKANYQSQTLYFFIDIVDKNTTFQLFFNNTDITLDNSIETYIGDYLNITMKYSDNLGNFIENATLELRGEGMVPMNLTLNKEHQYYNITLNTNRLNQGVNILSLFADKVHYQEISIKIYINILKRPTDFQLYLDGIDKTIEKMYEIPLGAELNVTIRYFDNITKTYINNAIIELRDGGKLIGYFDEVGQHYTIIIDSGELFDIDLKILTIIAEKGNFTAQSPNFRLNVRRIMGIIETEDKETTYNIRPGGSLIIKVLLKNEDFEGIIKKGLVKYTSELGQGEINAPNADGLYEINLENVPEGSYTITVTVYAGDDYEFSKLRITLNVLTPEEEARTYQIITMIAIASAIGVGGYLFAYQKVLKYPKQVRKIRSFKKTLKKTKSPDEEIPQRESAIKSLYISELTKVSRFFKGKLKQLTQEQKSHDKFIKAQDLGKTEKLGSLDTNQTPKS